MCFLRSENFGKIAKKILQCVRILNVREYTVRNIREIISNCLEQSSEGKLE